MIKSELKEWFYNFCVSFKKEVSILIVTIITFLSPIHGLFIIVGSMVMIDTFYGVYASIKLKGLRSITSHNMFNLAVKTFFYMGSILIAFLISKYMFESKLMGISYLVPKALCGFWVLMELKSIDETSIKLGHKPVIDIIKDIIAKAKSFKKDLNELKK